MSNSTRTLTTTLLGLAGAAAGGALLLAGPAASAAAAPASSTVSIQAQGTDLSGKVTSPRATCKSDRNVIVYKQVGSRGGGDDIRFAMDSTDSDGDWSTGNTGTTGKFYAKVKKNSQCKAAFSPTIRVTR